MDKNAQDFCTDCSQTKRFTRRWFNKTAVGGALIAVGVLSIEKDAIRNALTPDKTVPLSQQELQDWIKTPGLVDSYPMDGLPQEQQDAIKQAIRDGNTQFFTENGYGISKDEPKPGVVEAACGYYYTTQPTSACQSSTFFCHQCNGETDGCTLQGRFSHNNCAYFGYGPHCCG